MEVDIINLRIDVDLEILLFSFEKSDIELIRKCML